MAKIGLISLGCPKNLVDSEVMLGHLRQGGHVITKDMAEAEILIINTCGFIKSAKEESIQAILEAASMKRQGRCKKLVVAGCLVERHREELLAEMPEIDAVAGTREVEQIFEVIENCGRGLTKPADPLYMYSERSPRVLSTHPGMAYIKISEGCSHSCAFCAIPSIRGPQRSRPMAGILEEARRLVGQGVQELILVGQDTTDYGSDIGQPRALESLVRELGKISGLKWFRIQYAYPNRLSESLLEAIAETGNCCKYFDVPLQHVSPGVLKSMGRGGGRAQFIGMLQRIRERVLGSFVRSSFIVGFPGEDDAAFGELLDFVIEAQFDHLGVFAYSREEGTPAYPLGDTVHWRTKEKRRRILMEAQQGISRAKNQAMVGQLLEVLVEGTHEESESILIGRHQGQAPEIDGSVLIVDGRPELYKIQSVLVTEAHAYDLVGVIV
ncbi:MAG: 30S ribosomal protein S12 methylthiotransferase RimO [Holophagales bacterium]|jgi:ribosomal protein S12 methylthiotransferase|nr:30S ribosomal protein S12 methylthiotransferase RimO [Holophagales bacterium]